MNMPNFTYLCVYIYIYIHIHIYIHIYINESQIVYHNPCFNLFILHNNSFHNQGCKINKSDIFLSFEILPVFYKNFLPTHILCNEHFFFNYSTVCFTFFFCKFRKEDSI